ERQSRPDTDGPEQGRPARAGVAGGGARWRPGRVRTAGGAVPTRAAGPLLPHARLLRRRRGRTARDPASRLARPRAVRGPKLAPFLAVQDRYEQVLERDRATTEASRADRLLTRRRPPRPARRSSERPHLARAL